MPSPVPLGETPGTGGASSSAQADNALSAGSVTSIYGPGGQFRLIPSTDMEYRLGRTSTVSSRCASNVPRSMPAFDLNPGFTQYRQLEGIGERPVTMLPPTNLEKVTPPPGMSYEEHFTWDLANLLEGKQPAMSHCLPGNMAAFTFACLSFFHMLAGTLTSFKKIWTTGSVSLSCLRKIKRKWQLLRPCSKPLCSTRNKGTSFHGHSM